MELVIFVGLQGAGKSTFFTDRFAATHTRVSKDLMGRSRHKHHRQMESVNAALQAGESVVVDNTNATAADRAALIQLGRAHGGAIIGYVFATPLALCLRRNAARQGAARVPEIAIYATRKRLQPPTYAEGFDQLWEVQTAEDGAMRIIPVADIAPDDALRKDTTGDDSRGSM